jgi:hypothetical protein
MSSTRIKDIVRAPKSAVTFDGWQSGRMPKSVFPLGKSGKGALRFSGAYDWCCLRFTALNCKFRLVVAVNLAKQEYYAHLGMVCGTDTQMLASYEFHGTHPGWHVHAGCGDLSFIPIGRYMGPWRRRIPTTSGKSRRQEWDIPTLDLALARACAVFNIPTPTAGWEASTQMSLLS